jgi:putative DNA primase/helicase
MAENVGDESIYLRIRELKAGNIQFTDATNAERLLKLYGRDIRYNAAWKKWLVWDGKKWQVDDGALIHEKGLEMVRGLYDEQLKTPDYRERMEIEKYAMLSESVRRREAFIKAASWIRELNITSEDLDINPWLLSVQNGTIDIESGTFREHKQEDMITKIANVEYVPGADCPLWKQFIREIMGLNGDIIRFLQAVVGMAITGDVSEQSIFIFYGSGANGKSTFLNTIMYILGDYALTTTTETFMKRNNEQSTNDIARLRGSRFVTTTEVDQGKRLSEPLIKQITGNDKVTARFLYGEYFSYMPTYKIFMGTNHKPIIKGTDFGIWRRIKLIPFVTRIEPDKQDKHLEEKLRAEGPGILNWLLEGTYRWRKEGLVVPEAVSVATDDYKGEMDIIGNFLKECCIQSPGVSIRIRELFKAYQEWCEQNNEKAVSERILTSRLKEMGFNRIRSAEARYWSGIMLRAKAD